MAMTMNVSQGGNPLPPPPNPQAMAAVQARPKITVGVMAAEAAARKTANSFEQMFISEMLQDMPSGTDPNGPFGGGQAETMYRGMMNDQYAKVIAQRGGIGIADVIYKEILRMQERGREKLNGK